MAEQPDFIVIGGGIAGAAAAYELAARGRVQLLEREATCGQHSTGRSAALFTECYGDTLVRRLAIASRAFLEDPPADFADSPILSERGVLFVARPDQMPVMEVSTPDFQMYVPTVHRIEPSRAVEMCPALDPDYVAGGLLEPDARDIDVHALHQAFLRGIRSRGGRVSTSAPVTSITNNGASWTVHAGNEAFEAPSVVNAAGAWTDEVGAMAGLASIGLTPMRRTAFTFAAPAGHSRWPMVVDIDERFYFKPEGPSILASPADETPMAPCDVRHEEIDVAVGIDRVQAATTLQIRHVQSAWAGLRSFVADHRPVVGEDATAPGFFWLAGQGGFGIKTSPAMARAVTGLICDSALPRDISDLGITAADLSPNRLERTNR